MVEKLGVFCVKITQIKANIKIAEFSAAFVCNILLKKSKK